MTQALGSKASTQAGLSALLDLSEFKDSVLALLSGLGSDLVSALTGLSTGFSSGRGFFAGSIEGLTGSELALAASLSGSLAGSLTGSLAVLLGSALGFTGSFSGLATVVLACSGVEPWGSDLTLVSAGTGSEDLAGSGVFETNSSLPGLRASVGFTAVVLLEDMDTVGGGGGGGAGVTAGVGAVGFVPAK